GRGPVTRCRGGRPVPGVEAFLTMGKLDCGVVAAFVWSVRYFDRGGRSWTAILTPRRPFEPTSKRRRGFPLARPRSNAATGSSARTPNWWKSSAATTRARADPGGGFRRCCRPTGRFDDTLGHHYVRD